MSNENLFDIQWGLSVIRRRYRLIIGLTILTALVAFLAVSLMPRQYEDSVTLLVQPARDSQLSDYNVLLASQQMAITYSEMAKGRPILEAAIRQLGLNMTPEDLATQVSTTAIRDTQLVRITVRDTNSQRATAIANTVAQVFSAQVKTLQLDRYTDTLQSAKAKMDTASTQINDTQSQIDTLNAQKVKNDVDIARLESSLAEQKSRFDLYQQTYQSLQLSATNLEDNVKVFSPAGITGQTTSSSFIASTTLLIKEGTAAGTVNTTATRGIDVLAPTYEEMFSNPTVLKDAISKLSLSDDPATLAKSISAATVPGTQFIKLTVTNADDKKAVQLADAIAASFITQLRQKLLEPYSASLASTQAEIDAISKQMDETQANLQILTSENANFENQLNQLNTNIVTYRSDFRTFQQNYDNLHLTAASAADNVVITQPAGQAMPSQSRMLYVSIAIAVGLIVSVVLAFLLEAGRVEEGVKKMETAPVQAGR